MLTLLLGSILAVFMVLELREPPDTSPLPVAEVWVPDSASEASSSHKLQLKPESDWRFEGIVRQQYDYSCGSAALTTLYQGYFGLKLTEQDVMLGMLQHGETERIQARRSFSMLDMKRLTEALGFPAGGFKADLEDLQHLDHPAIVSIHYAGFRHFVIIKRAQNGRIFVADPATGHNSFTYQAFDQLWDQKVLFMAFPGEQETFTGLSLDENHLRIVQDEELLATSKLTQQVMESALAMGDIEQRLQLRQRNAYWLEEQGGRRLMTSDDKAFDPALADRIYVSEGQEKWQRIRYRR
jgi:predicted double-glycine peptidase